MSLFRLCIILSGITLALAGCKKNDSQPPKAEQASSAENGAAVAETVEDSGDQKPKSKQTTVQLDADTELCFSDSPCIAADDSTIQPMMIKRAAGCDPHVMPVNAVCRNNAVYCGEQLAPEAAPENWKCINDQWVCVAESCACGSKKTGKYGTCVDQKPMCGKSEIAAPDSPGYICQNNTYVCAAPTGCKCGKQDCPQFGKCNNNKCDKKKTSSKEPQLCEKGNCPCGEGSCAKNAYCFNEQCICGSPDYHNDVETFSSNYLISGQFGDFQCNLLESSSYYDQCLGREAIDYFYTLSCEKKEGCNLNGTTVPQTKHDLSSDDPCRFAESNSEVFDKANCNYFDDSDIYSDTNKKLIDDFNSYFITQACGRSTALEFKLPDYVESADESYETSTLFDCHRLSRCDTMPVPRKDRSKYICDRSLVVADDGYLEEWYEFDHFEYDISGLRCEDDSGCPCFDDICAKGQLCSNGVCMYDDIFASKQCKNFIKDIDHNKLLQLEPDDEVLQNGFFTFDYDKQTVIKSDGRIRWTNKNCIDVDCDTGKPISKNADSDESDDSDVCSERKCLKPDSVDDQYGITDNDIPAATSVRVLWAQKDLIEFTEEDGYSDSNPGPPSAFSIESAKHSFYIRYHNNTAGLHTTPSGTCICGQSVYTPESLDAYVCNPNRGYLCVSETGCSCGTAHCEKAQYCLRNGVCATWRTGDKSP